MKMYAIYPRHLGGVVVFVKAADDKEAAKLANDSELLPGTEAFFAEVLPGVPVKHYDRPVHDLDEKGKPIGDPHVDEAGCLIDADKNRILNEKGDPVDVEGTPVKTKK